MLVAMLVKDSWTVGNRRTVGEVSLAVLAKLLDTFLSLRHRR